VNKRPNIFEFLSYRTFLREMFLARKAENARFSYRVFSRLAGLKSSNFLKLVMEGKRNLSAQTVRPFAKALGLGREETNFFETLVLFDQAADADEKNRHYEKIAQFQSYKDISPLDVSQYAYFSNWHFVALRELVTLKDFKEDAPWINRRLKSKLHPEEIRQALRILVELKLLTRNTQGRLKQTVEKVSTTPEMGSLAVINFHREMLRKASESLEKSRTAHRDVSALTVGLSKAQFERIRDRIAQFRREIHAIASESGDKDAIYQINFQLFNLSEVPWS
jgi:uncharacterized protein (TIGR02147 family)